MSPPGGWLSPLMDVNGTEDEVLPPLYEVFTRDFVVGKPQLYGCQVSWNTRPSPGRNLYHEGFVHIVTKDGPPLMRREFEPMRAARVGWCAGLILNCDCPTVTAWDYKEGTGTVRRYLWRKDVQYVAILEKQLRKWGEVYYLVTAFHSQGASTEAKLQRKYEERVK